ncbi:zinc finger protein CONSTANS-LIKE 5-like isoform X1 [Mangifera indica]|uniref:zinc finger protein CONSTANS-LIKE 5-like isoform X1 n=1 Tax=Mangifera indica TaxID=29780 RepID=UPI001CFAA5D3|nr:zinc finger protein CONSTANS-LIKE 5-like isoform X1 [Mangifera indica]
MGIELQNHHLKGISGGWGVGAKPCDTCEAASAAVFCRVDSAFLCLSCDVRIHCVNKHARVWMCQVCEQAPATVTCKADAAALCVTCDNDIHSANPLARRHQRNPVEPFFDSADSIVKSSSLNFLAPNENGSSEFYGAYQHQEEGDVESGLCLMPPCEKLSLENKNEMKSVDMLFCKTDPFLDCEYPNSYPNYSAGMDSVVPVQSPKPPQIQVINNENCLDIDFSRSKVASLSYQARSLSQSVSSSDVGVVPDENSMFDTSYPFGQNIACCTNTNQATQLCGLDREARVLRYKEKRKNRKFEKTIRYHSRKAYAETRPRIKGRFAKRAEVDSDVERLYASAAMFMPGNQYGVVPTF